LPAGIAAAADRRRARRRGGVRGADELRTAIASRSCCAAPTPTRPIS